MTTDTVDIEESLRRLQARAAVFTPPPAEVPTVAQLDRDMEQSGYSLRSIRALSDAKGPAVEKAASLLPKMLSDGIILLLGPTGRGKTVMAAWIARERQKSGKKCGQFLSAYGLFSTVKSTYGGKSQRETAAGNMVPLDSAHLIREWSKAKFLVIDEIQTRAETPWEDAMLEEIINNRYGAMLPTLLIANLDAEKAQTSLGPRVIDRARECGGIVNCNWSSYRA